MATGNFYNRNSSKVYAIEVDDFFDSGELRDSIVYSLNKARKPNYIDVYERTGHDYERNFSGTYLACVSAEKRYNDYSIGVEIKCVVRSGYYSGANLDMEDTIYNIDGCEYDTIDGLLEWSELSEYRKNKVSDWLESAEDKIKDIIERVYSKNSESYNVLAQFSNGETLYSKC